MATKQAKCETGLARLDRKIADARVAIIVAIPGIVGLSVAILKLA
ncbi:MAG: hypothetical protein OXU19_15495 [bacterium]|nr:hypothetical protein [bacterium]MDE0242773.1 hypothetical protein [bacterium]MDE0418278.1 hypothetical protein [bacterium]